MKKVVIILMIAAAVAGQAQEKKGFVWKKMAVGAEFVHNITKGYQYSNTAILLDHPNNSVDIRVTYDFGRYWTLGAYGGFRLCRTNPKPYLASKPTCTCCPSLGRTALGTTSTPLDA